MGTKKNQSFNLKGNGIKKVNIVQLNIFYQFLQENTATASMISEATGLPQKNICRYKRYLEKKGQLWEIEKNLCKHTGFRAWYLTTNPEKTSFTRQLKLF